MRNADIFDRLRGLSSSFSDNKRMRQGDFQRDQVMWGLFTGYLDVWSDRLNWSCLTSDHLQEKKR